MRVVRFVRSLFCRHVIDTSVPGELFDVGRQKAFKCRKCGSWFTF